MSEKITTLESIIQNMENDPILNKLPPELRQIVKDRLNNISMVKFPIITFMEGNWVIATTPIIDVVAQGENEEDAINNLKAMINDYLSDPDTQKPLIRNIVNMQIAIREVPMTLPLGIPQSDNYGRGQNSPITTG